MREVDLDGPPGDEHPLADLGVRQSVRDQLHDTQLCGGEALPSSFGALALAPRATRPPDRVLQRELPALGMRLRAELGLQALTQLIELGLVVLPAGPAIEIVHRAVTGT